MISFFIAHHPRIFVAAVAVVSVAGLPTSLQGQTPTWQTSGSNIYVQQGMKVGIGTTSPTYPLDIAATSIAALRINGTAGIATSNNTQLRFAGGTSGELWAIGTDVAANNGSKDFHFYALPTAGNIVAMTLQSTTGNVGIGSTNPAGALHITSSANVWSSHNYGVGLVVQTPGRNSAIALLDYSGANPWAIANVNSTNPGTLAFVTMPALGNTNSPSNFVMSLTQGGNVGVGTTAPQHRLSVNGTVGAKEVIVTNTGWADYVFKPDYRPKPLNEVAAYIKEHHHLPEIPSEKEVRKKGISVGDMQVKLLAKIEELTLHMIQANERNDRLEQQNLELLQQNQASLARIARLEALVERHVSSQGVSK